MTVTPLPQTGEIFLDARAPERSLRVAWHHESGLVVLSLWAGTVCRGTFQLPVEEVPDLIETLRRGLDQAYDTIRLASSI